MANRGLTKLLFSPWAQIRRIKSVARLRPFDASTPEGRSRERYRRVALTALAAFISKAVSLVTVLVSVPLVLHYLGPERYGMWLTITSVFALLSFADMGLGNGLLNLISEADGSGDKEAAARYVSSAFFMLSGVALLLSGLIGVGHWLTPWGKVLNVSSTQALAEAGPAVLVFAVCFLVNLPVGVVWRVQAGYQEGFTSSLWQTCGSLLGLGSVLLGIHLRVGLPWLILALGGAQPFVALLNGAILFGFKRPWLRPRLRKATPGSIRGLLRVGIAFFALEAVSTLAYASDNIVAAQVMGAGVVPQYAVPMKLFSSIPILLGMAFKPLWPAYSESLSRGDLLWAKRTLARSLKLGFLITVPPSILLFAFGGRIIRVWTASAITPSILLLLGLSFWAILSSAGSAITKFLNGAGAIGFQVACIALVAVSGVIAKVLLCSAIGLPGIIWGKMIAHLLFFYLPIGIYLPKKMSALERHTHSLQSFAGKNATELIPEG